MQLSATSSTHPPEGKKQVLIIKKWKETFTYWKFKDKVILSAKSK